MKRLLFMAALIALVCLCALAFGEEEAHVHDWSDYAVTLEPTCTSTGTEVRICKICGANEIETLAMADHDYGPWQYYSDDQHVRYCRVCGASELQSHDSAITKNITAAAENRLGKKSITCAGCGYNYTRLASTYDRLYTQEGSDVLNNGTAYLKVNTLSLQQGSEKQLTVCSQGIFDLKAVTNVTVELYANVSSGEFRGIRLTSGSAVLIVSGENADLEFITLSAGAELQIAFQDGNGSLCISSSSKDLVYLDAQTDASGEARLNILTSALDTHALSIVLDSYLAPQGIFTLEGKTYKTADAQLLLNASWQYNTRSHMLSSSGTSGRLTVMSGSSVLLNGASSGTLGQNDVPWGWYCLYTASDETLTFATPTYSIDGLITGVPVNQTMLQENASAGGEGTQPDETTESEPEAQDNVLTAASSLSKNFGDSPKIDVAYANGMYSVRVSEIPKGTSLERIEFVQTYSGSIHMVTAYSASPDFTVENYSGKLRVTAVFTDGKGNEKRISAGEYEYRAE